MLEQKVKTLRFWVFLGAVNQCIMLLVLAYGCVASGMACQGSAMSDTLTLYIFTLFTPQLALTAIVLMACLLATNSWRDVVETGLSGFVFVISLVLLVAYAGWRWG